MRVRVGILGLMLTFWALAASVPPRPSPQAFVADYASLLSAEEKSSLVRQVNEQNQKMPSHLFIITVSHLKPYAQSDVEEAAKACFPAWGMGDSDVLLFLSARDRKARIQLGADWGRRWDLESQRIMRDVIVPACKEENYHRALSQGANRLLIVTAAGPEAALPAQNWYEKAENLGARMSARSGLSWQMCLAFLGTGCCLMLLSLLPFSSNERKFSGSLGLALVLSSWFANGLLTLFWILTGLTVLWAAGSLIQGGFQSGISLGGTGGGMQPDEPDSSASSSYSNESSISYGGSGADSGSSNSSDSGGATGSW